MDNPLAFLTDIAKVSAKNVYLYANNGFFANGLL